MTDSTRSAASVRIVTTFPQRSDEVLRPHVEQHTYREMLRSERMAELLGEYEAAHGPIADDEIARLWEQSDDEPEDSLAHVRVKLWICPNGAAAMPGLHRVEWAGNLATCLDCGQTNQPRRTGRNADV